MEKQDSCERSKDFHKFLVEICGELKEKCKTDDSIPLRHPNPRITPPELEGECLNWCLEYLSTRGCPAGFSGLIACEVYKHVLESDLQQFLTEDTWKDSPRINQESGDVKAEEKKEEIEYSAEKLHAHTLGALESICESWSESFPEIQIEGKVPTVSYHAIKNTRRKMEDRHVMIPDLNAMFAISDQPPQAFYGIFDGHAGTDAATYAAKHIHVNLVHSCGLEKNPVEACKSAFKVTDDLFIPKAKKERWRSGTTGVTALLRGDRVILSWLGDSQAVLVKHGKAVGEMEPHKPDRQDERERIQRAGGFVMMVGDQWRVGGNLAVSRAIGDIQYKPFVSSEAEVQEFTLDGTEEYLVLACDGLWDTLTSAELPHVVYKYMTESGGDASGIAKHLVKYAKDNESMDNISVIVIVFRENLAEPVADAGFFNFLSGAGNNGPGTDNSQGSNDNAGNHGDTQNDKSGADNSGETSSDSNQNPGAGNSAGNQDDVDGGKLYNEKNNDEQSREGTKPELLININHMSFEIGPEVRPHVDADDSDLMETSTEGYVVTDTGSEESSQREDSNISKRDEDLDCYGVFNTRLTDGPIDLSRISDVNSSALLKNIADDVYNLTPENVVQNEVDQTKLHLKHPILISDFSHDDSNFQESQTTDRYYYNTKKKSKKKSKLVSSLATERERKNRKGKDKGPVCWAFTGKNKATVQNFKLNLTAKTFNKGSNNLSGKNLPNVKPLPSKFAQTYSLTENVHDIANITLNPGKLDKLPDPRPKVLPSNLAKLSGTGGGGVKVFGSKSQLQNESQKFHTSWRPRKPLKPIASMVYETPPTPFVNNKLSKM